ncbi:hypothetical protein D3C72_1763330 [compost metagenome]
MQFGQPEAEVRRHVADLEILVVEYGQIAALRTPLPDTDAGAIQRRIQLFLEVGNFSQCRSQLRLQLLHLVGGGR